MALKQLFAQKERQAVQTPKNATSTARREAVERNRNDPLPIKDLSRDELIVCIRELESELGESLAVIDEYWGMVDLQVWLRGLEQLKKTGRRVPVPIPLIL